MEREEELNGRRGEEREPYEVEFFEDCIPLGLIWAGISDSDVGDADEKEENGDGGAEGEVDVEAW